MCIAFYVVFILYNSNPRSVLECTSDSRGVHWRVGDELRDDDYIITVRYPGTPPRNFEGIESSVTWELERRPCYFVGSGQAGPLAEVSEPNDSVIEGVHSDYNYNLVTICYSYTSYIYSHFLEGRCT